MTGQDAVLIFGDDLAVPGLELVRVVTDKTLDRDVRERARRALLVIHPDSPLGQLPTVLAKPAGPGPVAQVAAAMADLTTYTLTAATSAERVRLGGLVAAVLREAQKVRPALEALERAS